MRVVAAGMLALGLLVHLDAIAESLPRTTAPEIARKNLDYGIVRGARQLDATPQDARTLAGWLDVLFTRIDMYGTFDDFVEADQRTLASLNIAPDDIGLLVQRARLLQRIHRFDEAIELLDRARARLGDVQAAAPRARHAREIEAQSRTVALARGEGAAVLRDVASTPPGFSASTQKGAAELAAGRPAEAEAAYRDALQFWDGISPFALAWIEFSIGEAWNGRDDARARRHFERAVAILPEYVKARVHLSELVAKAEGPAAAVEVLAAVLAAQDPEPAARTAEFLAADGRPNPALARDARRRWAELLERFPLAFADHGAEFYLAAGADPERALYWARQNHANRTTQRAIGLLIRAALAAGEDACIEPALSLDEAIDPMLIGALEERLSAGISCR